jgi:hypothetical protein
MTQFAICDDHDIRAVVTIDFVKPKSQEKGVDGVATLQNYDPGQIVTVWA